MSFSITAKSRSIEFTRPSKTGEIAMVLFILSPAIYYFAELIFRAIS